MPCNMAAAALSKSSESGIFTSFHAVTTAYSAYDPRSMA